MHNLFLDTNIIVDYLETELRLTSMRINFLMV